MVFKQRPLLKQQIGVTIGRRSAADQCTHECTAVVFGVTGFVIRNAVTHIVMLAFCEDSLQHSFSRSGG